MAKAKSNNKPRRATSATKVTKAKSSSARSSVSATKGETVHKPAEAPHANTKQASILAMLSSPSGATIDAMVKATGWQQHSVRGFLASVVRKKLGLNLVSEAADSGRVYRVKAKQSSKSTAAV